MTTYHDIVLVHEHTPEIIAMAKRLGYASLLFAVKDSREAAVVRQAASAQGSISCSLAFLDRSPNQHASETLVLRPAAADLRATLEHARKAIVVTSSRLDQVACASAQRNENTICLPLGDILRGNTANAVWNIRLCRTYLVRTAIASLAANPLDLRGPLDIISLFARLGMEPATARAALQKI